MPTVVSKGNGFVPVFEKQLTGLRPDGDGRKWLCALLKNE
jgi:hypothetical protein